MVLCRCAVRFNRLRGKAATKSQSSVLSPQSAERGFSLVSAIFLLVVIAALGTFAVTLSTTQQQGAALDLLGARAYQAARAGIEWGAFQALQGGGAAWCIGAPNTLLPALPGTLSGFTVNVACSATTHSDTGATAGTVTIFNLTSSATQGVAGQADYVERQINATIAR